MNLPFTQEQFFDVFRHYNEAVWPAQVAMNVMALLAIGLLAWRGRTSDRVISGILATLWAWTGIAYHVLWFSTINKAAFAFAVIFLAGAVAFLWYGVIRNRLQFTSASLAQRMTGGALLVYALIAYPLLSTHLGHAYPAMPTFGLPCPTTIFTIGLLCFLTRPLPRTVVVAPVLWSAIGTQAAFLLDVIQDLGLGVAGVAGMFLLARPNRHKVIAT